MEAANPTKFVEESLKFEETKRRRREGIVILITALMVAALIFFEVQLPDVSPEYSLGSNIVFFLLINVNIILLGLLVFLVVRNLVKLVVERKRHMLGSRLQVAAGFGFCRTFAGSQRVAVHHCRWFADAAPSIAGSILKSRARCKVPWKSVRPIIKTPPTTRFFMRVS